MRFHAVIFDLDGTLIDSSPGILACFATVLKEAGLHPRVPLTDSLIGPPLQQTLINLTGVNDSALLDRLAEGFKECYDTEGFKSSRVYEGVHDMLARLTKYNIPLAIATNKRRVPTLKILHYLGWENYFRLVGTLDTTLPPYPDKASLIGYLLNEMSMNPETTAYLGDKREDGEAANANNMPFCAAAWGYGDWERIRLTSDWRVFSSAEEFGNMLQE